MSSEHVTVERVSMEHISALLAQYRRTWLPAAERRLLAGRPYRAAEVAEEAGALARFDALVATGGGIFERDSYVPGHVTGSALVVSPGLDRVLLTLHGKLGLWLQLGGHTDGHPIPHEAAYREALEESGLASVRFFPWEELARAEAPAALQGVPLPFDLDVHAIPARRDAPEHSHYDLRYLIVADPEEPLAISEESKDLRWFDLDEAWRVTAERSMHRQFEKLVFLAGLAAETR